MNMTYSEQGLALTKSFEGYSGNAYKDTGGVATIGFGHTHGVEMGMICTTAEAEAWLREDVAFAVMFVNKLVKVPLTQNQFDPLVDFVFNVGSSNFQASTLLRKLNEKDYIGAANEFSKWDKVRMQVSDGLARRREAEKKMFMGVPWNQ